MTCEALINKFLLDYHAGTLPLARKLEFELHLGLCADCRTYLDSYRKTVLLTKHAAAPEEPPPQQLVDAILKLTSRKET